MIIETIKKSINKNLSMSDALKLTKIEFISGKYGEKYASEMLKLEIDEYKDRIKKTS